VKSGRLVLADRVSADVLSESRVEGLVRPVYTGDGNGNSGDGVVVQPSPAGGVLPVGRRPIRARRPTGSGC
jgi:hypothetical protein